MKKFAGILLLVCLVFIGCANPVNNNDNPTNPFVPGNPDIPANPDPVDSAFWFKEVYEKLIERVNEISTDDYTGSTGSGTGQIANLQYICDAINAKWGTAYTPAAGTANQAANCEYLLKMFDKANSNHTTYGTGEYATKQVVDTTAVNDAMNRLWAPGSKFIGVNGYAYGNLYSADGIAWQKITSVSHIKDIVYGNGKFVGYKGSGNSPSNGNGTFYSTDGITWNGATLPAGVNYVYDVRFY
jgi:hypothetical protein